MPNKVLYRIRIDIIVGKVLGKQFIAVARKTPLEIHESARL